MIKKIVFNIFLVLTTYVVPLFLLHQYRNDYRNIDFRQNIIFSVLFLGSSFIFYLNNTYIKEKVHYKWFWVSFKILGVLGLLVSVSVLLLLFSTQNLLN